MIRKSILTTGLLLLLYSLFISVFRDHIQRTAQVVEQRNTVKAEEFLYEDGRFADTIVLGSSMSSRLTFDSLPGHYYNLALEGMSAIDGLRLISQNNRTPRLLLVEINTLDHAPDTTFFTRLAQGSWTRLLREYVPFTRLKYQPVGVAKALLRDWRASTKPELPEVIDTAFVTKVLQERLTHLSDMPDEPLLQYRIGLAEGYLHRLHEKGTQIVFFEMPTDLRIRNSPVNSRIRELIDTIFPAAAYRHITFPTEIYQTTDGVHLPRVECARYTQYLYQQLKQIKTSS